MVNRVTLEKVRAKAASTVLELISPVIGVFEKHLVEPYGAKEVDQKPVFIIGAPRTGSTILYQALTSRYNLSYIDNTACRWHRNLFFGMWLSHRKYGGNAHHNFESNHGDTARHGGHAPSECGDFWYRWLPKDRHFIDEPDFTEDVVREIRREIISVISYFGKPFIFKNLNAGQRLRLLVKVFPEAKFIFIRRDPRFVVRSILRARRKAGVGEGQWWSIMPPNHKSLLELPEPKMCAGQVYYIERQIEKDLVLFPEENRKILHYRDMNPESIGKIADWLALETREGGRLPTFRKDDPAKLPPPERHMLESAVGDYPFELGLFE